MEFGPSQSPAPTPPRPLHRAHCTGGPMRGGGGHYAGATVQVAESSWGMATMHTQFGWGPGVGHEVPTMVGGFLWNATYSGAREGCPLCS